MKKVIINESPEKLYELSKTISLYKIAKQYNVDYRIILRDIKKINPNFIPKGPIKKAVNDKFFENIDNENKAYWLGFLYADGCVSYGRISLNLGIKDVEHIEIFRKNIESEMKIDIRETKTKIYKEGRLIKCNSYPCATFAFKSKKMSNDLINLGCVPRKSLVLQFPNNKQVPDNLLYHFIRGWFDGDGSLIVRKDGLYSLKFCGTLNMISKLQEILLKNNLIIKKTKINKDKGQNVYYINIGRRNDVFSILNWMYKDSHIHLLRKYEKYLNAICNPKLYKYKEELNCL